MYAIYEEQRAKVTDEFKTEIARAQDYAASQIKRASERVADNHTVLAKVTEDYIRRGYNLIEGWDSSVGQYRTTGAYLRRLAKQMKRRYIVVKHATWRNHSQLVIPNAEYLAPLYAHLLVVAKEKVPQNPIQNTVIHVSCSSQHRFDFYGADGAIHPLALDWVVRADTDPEWRKLLVGNV